MKRVIIDESQYNKLLEVRYIDTRNKYSLGKVEKKDPNQVLFQEPIKNDEVIRVFHGCDLETAVRACLNGISGREKPIYGRSYSYEAGMNPLGLFVTTDFYRAKDFGSSNEGMCILEFSAKACDLETPVWNYSGSYFGQGSNPMPFKDASERNAQKMRYRDEALSVKDDYTFDHYKDKDGNFKTKKVDIPMDFIRKSDKPEMAYNIFMNNEHQALFMGDLDPNMIKRVWVNMPQDSGYVSTTASYQPMSRREFVKKFRDKEFYVRGYYNKKSKVTSDKLFKPNENVKSIDDVIARYCKMENCDFDEMKSTLNEFGFFDKDKVLNMFNKTTLSSLFYPRQIIQIYGDDFFRENFNWLGQ